MRTIYERLLAIGATMDNHESDLYVLDTPAVRAEIQRHEQENGCKVFFSPFTSNIDHKPWLEIVGAWDPFWQRKRPGGPDYDKTGMGHYYGD